MSPRARGGAPGLTRWDRAACDGRWVRRVEPGWVEDIENAAEDGDTERVRRLLALGCHPDLTERELTPLLVAASDGQAELARALLGAGAWPGSRA